MKQPALSFARSRFLKTTRVVSAATSGQVELSFFDVDARCADVVVVFERESDCFVQAQRQSVRCFDADSLWAWTGFSLLVCA